MSSTVQEMGLAGFDALDAIKTPEEWRQDERQVHIVATVKDLVTVYAAMQLGVVELEREHDHESAMQIAQLASEFVTELLAAVAPVEQDVAV